MAQKSDVNAVELEGEYYHVRFRDPDRFDSIRTPDWADKASDSVLEGTEVRMGKNKDSDDWNIQSVLIPRDRVDGEDEARDKAVQVAEKIES